MSADRLGDPKAVEVKDPLVETLLDQVRRTASASLVADPLFDSPADFVKLPLLKLSWERLWVEESKARLPSFGFDRPRHLAVLRGSCGSSWTVAFSPEGRQVVTGSQDNTARVWNLSGATVASATVLVVITAGPQACRSARMGTGC